MRFYSVIGVVAGPPLMVVSVLAPAGSASIPLRIVGVAFGLLFTYGGIGKMRDRRAVLEITEAGIYIAANVAGFCISTSLLRDLFIPWERIASMEYLTRDQVQARGTWLASGGWGMSDPVIALDLRADASWPPSEVLRHDTLTRSLPPGQIYLNATRTAPNERKLWEKMRGIAIRYGIATP